MRLRPIVLALLALSEARGEATAISELSALVKQKQRRSHRRRRAAAVDIPHSPAGF